MLSQPEPTFSHDLTLKSLFAERDMVGDLIRYHASNLFSELQGFEPMELAASSTVTTDPVEPPHQQGRDRDLVWTLARTRQGGPSPAASGVPVVARCRNDAADGRLRPRTVSALSGTRGIRLGRQYGQPAVRPVVVSRAGRGLHARLRLTDPGSAWNVGRLGGSPLGLFSHHPPRADAQAFPWWRNGRWRAQSPQPCDLHPRRRPGPDHRVSPQ